MEPVFKYIRPLLLDQDVDYRHLTSLWPDLELGKKEQKKIQPWVLPNPSLQDSFLEFQKPLIGVLGGNGKGKTTFLKTLARSLANALYYQEHSRTALFGGNFHAECPADLEELNATGGYDHYTDRQGISLYPLSSPKSAEITPLAFYLKHGTFQGPHWEHLSSLPREKLVNRLFSILNDFGWMKDRTLEPEYLKSLNSLGNQDEMLRRACFLAETGYSCMQWKTPLNVFGYYELETSVPLESLTLGIYEKERRGTPKISTPFILTKSLKKEDSMNPGTYGRAVLEDILAKKPSLVLLDEPTAFMDRSNRAWFLGKALPEITAFSTAFIATNDESVIDGLTNLDAQALDLDKERANVTNLKP